MHVHTVGGHFSSRTSMGSRWG